MVLLVLELSILKNKEKLFFRDVNRLSIYRFISKIIGLKSILINRVKQKIDGRFQNFLMGIDKKISIN